MGKNQDPGSGINIPDPQHCRKRIRIQFSDPDPQPCLGVVILSRELLTIDLSKVSWWYLLIANLLLYLVVRHRPDWQHWRTRRERWSRTSTWRLRSWSRPRRRSSSSGQSSVRLERRLSSCDRQRGLQRAFYLSCVRSSVADPDPDPHAFGPPGSGSGVISQRYGAGSGSGLLNR